MGSSSTEASGKTTCSIVIRGQYYRRNEYFIHEQIFNQKLIMLIITLAVSLRLSYISVIRMEEQVVVAGIEVGFS